MYTFIVIRQANEANFTKRVVKFFSEVTSSTR